MTKREKVIRGLEAHANPKTCETCAGEDCPYYSSGGSYTEVTCSSFLAVDALALLKEQEVTPSYNDAVDTIKFQSKVIGFACETLAGYESEEPCNTLFYIKEERQKCDERCCNDKTPDEWCWRRYLSLMATGDSPTPEQMRDTKWEGEDDG